MTSVLNIFRWKITVRYPQGVSLMGGNLVHYFVIEMKI